MKSWVNNGGEINKPSIVGSVISINMGTSPEEGKVEYSNDVEIILREFFNQHPEYEQVVADAVRTGSIPNPENGEIPLFILNKTEYSKSTIVVNEALGRPVEIPNSDVVE